jgi:hypothetical protein
MLALFCVAVPEWRHTRAVEVAMSDTTSSSKLAHTTQGIRAEDSKILLL